MRTSVASMTTTIYLLVIFIFQFSGTTFGYQSTSRSFYNGINIYNNRLIHRKSIHVDNYPNQKNSIDIIKNVDIPIVPANAVPSFTDDPPEIDFKTYAISLLLFGVCILCSLDRVAMSVAVIPMGLDLGYSDSDKGAISSIFSLGYMCGLIPTGILGSFTSPKIILSVGVFIWSLAQIASPICAHISLPALYACRFAMGFAESCTIPTVQSFVARLIPEANRSQFLGAILSGLQIGNVGAFLISPMVLKNFDWSGLFTIYGLLGLAWIALWIPTSKDKDNNPTLVASNIQIEIQTETTNPIDPISSAIVRLKEVPWIEILTCKEVSAVAVAHAVQNFGLYINLAWLPTYFYQSYGLSVDDSSFASVGPWVGAAALGVISGSLADVAMKKGVSKTSIRRSAQFISLMVPACALYSLSINDKLTVFDASLYLITVCSFAAVSVAGFGSSIQDLCRSPKLVSVVYAITSVPAVLVGSLGVYGTGLVLDHYHNWNIIFQGMAAINCFGALFYASRYEAVKRFD